MMTASANVFSDSASSPSLKASLREQLLSLPFHGFARCMVQLLERMDYSQVQLAGRTDWKGRNQHGGGSGFDLTAITPGDLSKRRVVIGLKQFGPEQKVYQRTLDELRGACLRVSASEALLITSGPVSPSVRAPQAAPLAPVAVLEGDELLILLVQHRVGITEVEGYLKLDTALFADLRRESEGNGPADCRGSGSGGSAGGQDTARSKRVSSLRVTVQVEPLGTVATRRRSH